MNFSGRIFCGNLTARHIGHQVQLCGWVDAYRDHGGIIFVHLRDRSGIVQIVFDPEITPRAVSETAASLRTEYCVCVEGKVRQRLAGTENPHIETGQIEVIVDTLSLLSESEPSPFTISEKAMVAGADKSATESVSEEVRLQYRYLDIRRHSMYRNLLLRHKIFQCVRSFLDEEGFIEVETPILTMSTPEGARDYLVPSRVHQGSFYALPQSPQLFKQLLMIGGLERYFQLARCFRDEDLRPNRQPEFTQLDLEASFIDEEFLYAIVEELTVRMFAVGGITLCRPFPRMSYTEAMDTTGSDRPDLRFGLRIVDATDLFTDTNYSIFRQILKRGGCIKGINVKGQSEALSKNVLQNEYAREIAPSFGAKGMTWMRAEGGRLESNIVQFFSETELAGLQKRFDLQDGDVLIMVADPSYTTVISALGQLRLHLAGRLGLIPENTFYPVWITEFPLFEPTDDGGITSSHHPFTAPDRTDFDPKNIEELLSLHSRAYDLVMNGEELGGGSIRINNRDLQRKIFAALGLTEDDMREKFGFFLRAFDHGAPPHGGLALGMDRVVSMILGTQSIRDVIAFPKNRSAACPLTGAPAAVKHEQLAELGLLNLGGKQDLPGAAQKENRLDRLSWLSRIGIAPDERPVMEDVIRQAEELAGIACREAGDDEPVRSVMPAPHRTRPGIEAKRTDAAADGRLMKSAPVVKGNFYKVPAILE